MMWVVKGTHAWYNASVELMRFFVMTLHQFVCIGLTNVVFVEFFNTLFFDSVNDALYSNGSDCLLEFKLFLESCHFLLED